MICFVPLFFLIGLILFEPIYLQVIYRDGKIQIYWLPKVFCGVARPVLIRLHNSESRSKKYTWKEWFYFLRSCSSAFQLEQLHIQSSYGEYPAFSAVFWGMINTICCAKWPNFFSHQIQLSIEPFVPGFMKVQSVIRVTWWYLFFSYMKWRFNGCQKNTRLKV